MKALFIVSSPYETTLPPMDAENGYCLHYTENGKLAGGYSVVGPAPQPNTQIIWIETSEAVIEQMAQNPDYLYLGDVL